MTARATVDGVKKVFINEQWQGSNVISDHGLDVVERNIRSEWVEGGVGAYLNDSWKETLLQIIDRARMVTTVE